MADKKPYFFKYKYKALNKEYRDYIIRNDRNSQTRFGLSLEEILSKKVEELSEDQYVFLSYYKKHLPVIDTDCVMNKICKYIESIDFEIKKKIKNSYDFDYKILQTDKFNINKKIYEQIVKELNNSFAEWVEKRKIESKDNLVRKNAIKNDEKLKFEKELEFSFLKNKLLEICSNEEQLANHLVYYFYVDKISSNKNILWSLVGKQLYENIKSNTKAYYFPIKNEKGTIKFLYENYSIERIILEDNLEESDMVD